MVSHVTSRTLSQGPGLSWPLLGMGSGMATQQTPDCETGVLTVSVDLSLPGGSPTTWHRISHIIVAFSGRLVAFAEVKYIWPRWRKTRRNLQHVCRGGEEEPLLWKQQSQMPRAESASYLPFRGSRLEDRLRGAAGLGPVGAW